MLICRKKLGLAIVEKRVADLTLAEFLSYEPHKEPESVICHCSLFSLYSTLLFVAAACTMLISLLLLNMQVEMPLFRKTKDGRIFEWEG